MGYKITYSRKKHGGAMGVIAFFGIILLCSGLLSADLWRSQIFPAELEVLIQQIRQGSDIMEAVTVFCQELLDGA